MSIRIGTEVHEIKKAKQGSRNPVYLQSLNLHAFLFLNMCVLNC